MMVFDAYYLESNSSCLCRDGDSFGILLPRTDNLLIIIPTIESPATFGSAAQFYADGVLYGNGGGCFLNGKGVDGG